MPGGNDKSELDQSNGNALLEVSSLLERALTIVDAAGLQMTGIRIDHALLTLRQEMEEND